MTGSQVCRYTAQIQYEGKTALEAYCPEMNIPRAPTWHETEARALAEAERQVAAMWQRCFPDGTPLPRVTGVRLGHMTFVPDDYEWRRS